MSETFAAAVYLLCASTSALCAGLLLRGYRRHRVKLLLWSGVCFIGLVANNVILVIDLVVLPELDLSVWRALPAVAGLLMLVCALVWESA